MNLNIYKKIIFILFILLPVLCFSQKNDTIFYGKNKIRSVEVNDNENKILESFLSINGENLLVNENFKYSYFDSIMGSIKVVLVENKAICQEYWISGNDTIYDRAKVDTTFDAQVNRFCNFVASHLLYPLQAQNKGVHGKVYVSFVVNKAGDITHLKALTKLGYEIENTVLNLVLKYGRWGFIKLNNETVNFYFKMPVRFIL